MFWNVLWPNAVGGVGCLSNGDGGPNVVIGVGCLSNWDRGDEGKLLLLGLKPVKDLFENAYSFICLCDFIPVGATIDDVLF